MDAVEDAVADFDFLHAEVGDGFKLLDQSRRRTVGAGISP